MKAQLMLFALVAVATAEPELIFKHSNGKECSMEYDGAELATDCKPSKSFGVGGCDAAQCDKVDQMWEEFIDNDKDTDDTWPDAPGASKFNLLFNLANDADRRDYPSAFWLANREYGNAEDLSKDVKTKSYYDHKSLARRSRLWRTTAQAKPLVKLSMMSSPTSRE
jgi:hypothetical protein